MKKIYGLLIAITLLLPSLAHAQQVREETLKKGKEHMAGYTVRYKHSKNITKETLKELLEQNGLKKAKHKKGFYMYKGENMAVISPTKNDYYYKVTGNKHKATVKMAVSKGYNNYVSSTTDATTSANITNFLTDLSSKIELKQQLIDKQAELDKLNKNAEKAEKEKAKKQAEVDKLKTQQTK